MPTPPPVQGRYRDPAHFWYFIGIAVLVLVVVGIIFAAVFKKEGYSFGGDEYRRLGAGAPGGSPDGPSLNCYLKSQTLKGVGVVKHTTTEMGSDGAIYGIDIVNGIKLDSPEDEGTISIVSVDGHSWDFSVKYGQVCAIPFFPMLGSTHFFKKSGKGISATVYGVNLSGDVKRDVWANRWTYYFFNYNCIVQGGAVKTWSMCDLFDRTGNVGCGDIC